MGMKIISLIASATEIVHALGIGQYQVGRSHECDFPPQVDSLPVCTQPKFPVEGNSREIDTAVKDVLREAVSVYDVLEEKLERLQPTHIVTQSQCEVCAVSLKDVQRALSQRLTCNPEIVSLEPYSLGDVWTDIRTVADSLAIPERGRQLVSELQHRIRSVASRAKTLPTRPRVACIEWMEPLMMAGNWMPELVEMAGGINLIGEIGKHSGTSSWKELVDADPDILVLLPCGWDMPKIAQEMYWLTDRPGWNSLKAVQAGRVYITDGNQYFNRPGPRLAESARILAEIIHPRTFAPDFEGRAWKRAALR